VLLVVIDQPRVRGRGDDCVEHTGELELARVAVQDLDAALRPHARELLQARQRVERVAADEVVGLLDRLAFALVLVTVVWPGLRDLREVEVEMSGQPRRPRSAREHDPQHVGMLVLADQRPEAQQVFARLRREPRANVRALVARLAVPTLKARERIAQLVLQDERLVLVRLDLHQQAVERGDINADGVQSALERLHERRP
jgi:hypothetical protein